MGADQSDPASVSPVCLLEIEPIHLYANPFLVDVRRDVFPVGRPDGMFVDAALAKTMASWTPRLSI
jgi:hypothetical protein